MSRFDDEPSDAVETAEQIEAKGKLYCPAHLVALVCYKSSKARGKAYYKCPVPNCKHTDAKLRSKCRFPDSPQLCPCCSKPDAPVACEQKRYLRYTVVMACPQCEFDVEIPRPDIEHQQQRFKLEEIRKVVEE